MNLLNLAAGYLVLLTVILHHVTAERALVEFTKISNETVRGTVTIHVQDSVQRGWNVVLKFQAPIHIYQISNAAIVSHSGYYEYTFGNKEQNPNFSANSRLVVSFLGRCEADGCPPSATATLIRTLARNSASCPSITSPAGYHTENASVDIFERWPGAFKAKVSITTRGRVDSWLVCLKFSEIIKLLQVPRAMFERLEGNYFILRRMPWMKKTLEEGEQMEIEFTAYTRDQYLPCIMALFAWKGEAGSSTTPEMPTSSTTATMASIIAGTTNPQSTTIEPPTGTPTISSTIKTHKRTAQDCQSAETNNRNGYTYQSAAVLLNSEWPSGFKATIQTVIIENISNGWNIELSFSADINHLQMWRAFPDHKSGKQFILKNMPWNRKLVKGTKLEISFLASKTSSLPKVCAVLTWKKNPASTSAPSTSSPSTSAPSTSAPSTSGPSTSSPSTSAPSTSGPSTSAPSTSAPSTSSPSTSSPSTSSPSTSSPSTSSPSTSAPSTSSPSTSSPNTSTPSTSSPSTSAPSTSSSSTSVFPTTKFPKPYNYSEVLHKSILFYEAQRSGYLPSTNRISWRGNSATNDKGANGEDLVGGWYDAGDHVKFGFPMAFSTTLLTWGLLEYRDAYVKADELQNMLNCIKWPLDYFLKAHVKADELYGQVGDAYVDHSYWGRPEYMTMKRKAFKITSKSSGSDLAAETAAAMAAGSIAFRTASPSYADRLLTHAKQLFSFADQYRGLYTQSITNAREFYNSVSYKDELVWGALWLYKATSDGVYLRKAESYFSSFGLSNPGWAFSWDEKVGGLQLMLYQLTKKQIYKDAIERTLNTWLPGGGITYTPKGLAWRLTWGPNRYAANTAFLALLAADQRLNSKAYREFGKKQIHYMLGDSGRSYVVGFGKNPPVNPHHRGSSCAVNTRSCSINDPTPNPNILYGALVGGPDQNDNYQDRRQDYVMNEVATDYNAGFQSAVAALMQATE